jgi:hypothetical protein
MAGEYEILYGRDLATVKAQLYRSGLPQEAAGGVTLTRVGAADQDKYVYRGNRTGAFLPASGDEICYFDDTDGDNVPIGSETWKPVTTSAVDPDSVKTLIEPAGYQGDFKQNDEVCFIWGTNHRDEVLTLGDIIVYKDGSETQLGPGAGSGITDTREFDNIDLGEDTQHLVKIDLSANAWYAAKANYTVMLKGASIDGETVDAVLASFSIENRNQGIQFRRDG